MRILSNNQEMTYLDQFDDLEPDLMHLGIASYPHARRPLAEHTHPGAIEFVYVATGTLRYYVGSDEFEVRGGQVFASFPDEIHGTGPAPEERSFFGWAALRLDGKPNIFLSRSGVAAVVLREQLKALKRRVFSGSPILMQLLERAVRASLSPLPYAPMVLHGAIVEFVTNLLENYHAETQTEFSPPIMIAKTLIEKHLTSRVTLEEIATASGLPLPTFKRRFKLETGMPPYEYLLRRKILRACELLCGSRADITAIAYDLGFSSSQHFAVVFKKWMCQSPRQYRAAGRIQRGTP